MQLVDWSHCEAAASACANMTGGTCSVNCIGVPTAEGSLLFVIFVLTLFTIFGIWVHWNKR